MYDRKRYESHREEEIARVKSYYFKHREEILERKRVKYRSGGYKRRPMTDEEKEQYNARRRERYHSDSAYRQKARARAKVYIHTEKGRENNTKAARTYRAK